MCVKWLWKGVGTFLALWFSLSLAVVAQAEALQGTMRVAPGDQKVLNFPESVAKVATSDPKVAALTVTGSEELLLTAKAEGSAVISVWLRGQSKPLLSTVVVATTLGSADRKSVV